jgi:NADPH-dependent 7-cyano-7-deazaguanine reductase QueF
MKQLTFDPVKASQERLESERKALEDKKRATYLESLRKNRNFQKYVVDEIIKKNITALTDTRLIAKAYEKSGGDIGKKEELGSVVLQSIMASKQLESILGDLI